MNSCIYRGVVRHRRFSPVRHRLRLPLFMMYLDLSELDDVFRHRWLWSCSRLAPARFKRADHLGDPAVPLDTAVRDLVEARTSRRPEGPIRLLTHLRYFGFAMNPISLFFCHDRNERITSVVAEVSNTPWGERHLYVLQPEDATAPTGKIRCRTVKQFHVSPFMAMDVTYRWTLSRPGRRFALHLENHDDTGKLFDATLTMSRRPIRGAALNGLLLRYPFMTAQVLASIYGHAAWLWLKGAPLHPHPRVSRPLGERR